MFAAVSEWIEAGHMNTGFEYFEGVVKESDKAVAFKAQKWNRAANLYSTVVWFPKSKAQKVINDYYTHESSACSGYLIPSWMVEKKRQDGFEI